MPRHPSKGPGWGGPAKGVGDGNPKNETAPPGPGPGRGNLGIKGMAKAERIERWRGVLDEIATDGKMHPGARVSAAINLLDRDEGKPRQDVDLRHFVAASAAADADLLAIAFASGGIGSAQTQGEDESSGLVH